MSLVLVENEPPPPAPAPARAPARTSALRWWLSCTTSVAIFISGAALYANPSLWLEARARVASAVGPHRQAPAAATAARYEGSVEAISMKIRHRAVQAPAAVSTTRRAPTAPPPPRAPQRARAEAKASATDDVSGAAEILEQARRERALD